MRLLVVEDDPAMASLLQRALQREGYAVDLVATGTDALWAAREHPYDGIVLDAMIPQPDGFAVCSRLRRDQVWTPILMLTARDAVSDRVRGLDAGADDYLSKPFALTELYARLRAVTRRGREERPVVLRVGDLELDPVRHVVRRAGEIVDLSGKEFALLHELLRHAGQVLTRTHLLDHIWDVAYDGASNVVDVYIRYLRDKIDRPFGRRDIETICGVGYRFRASPDPTARS